MEPVEFAAERLQEFWKKFMGLVPRQVQKLKEIAQAKSKYPHKTRVYGIGESVFVRQERTNKQEDQYNGPYTIAGATKLSLLSEKW